MFVSDRQIRTIENMVHCVVFSAEINTLRTSTQMSFHFVIVKVIETEAKINLKRVKRIRLMGIRRVSTFPHLQNYLIFS